MQTVTAAEFAKTHQCDADFVRDMGNNLVHVFQPGEKCTYSGFDATVKEHCFNGMYNICLDRGGACVSGSYLIPA